MAARGSSKLNQKPASETSTSIVAGQTVFIEKRLAPEDSRHLSYILPGTVHRAPFGCFYVILDDHPNIKIMFRASTRAYIPDGSIVPNDGAIYLVHTTNVEAKARDRYFAQEKAVREYFLHSKDGRPQLMPYTLARIYSMMLADGVIDEMPHI